MKLLYRTIKTFTLDGMSAVLRVKTDGQRLYLNVSPLDEPSGSLSLTAQYGGVSRTLSSTPFRETEAVFPYDDEVKNLTLSGMSPVYGGVSRSVFSWVGSADDPDPVVQFSCPGFRSETTASFSWSLSDASGRPVCLTFVALEYWSADGTFERRSTVITEPAFQYAAELRYYIPSTVPPGTRIRASFCYASYDSPSDAAESFTGLTELVTPVYTVSGTYAAYAPYELNAGRAVLGASLRLSWHPVEYDRLIGYELQRSVNGGGFTMVYSGPSCAFTDSVGRDWESVVYRVRALAYGGSSVFHLGDTMIPLRSNVYVGHGGQICPAEGMRLGTGGSMAELVPIFRAG